MRIFILGVFLLSLFSVANCFAEERSCEKPNILLISIDDLNDWVGCLGGHPQAKTPFIDQLAKEGVLFTNAHCQAPVCTPSRASLVSGMLPSSTGSYFLQPHINKIQPIDPQTTLVPWFQKEGYETLGAGKVYGGHNARFFKTYPGRLGGFGPTPKDKKKLNHPIGHPLWDWGAYPDTDEEMPDRKIADWAIEQLKQPRAKPFFLSVGFNRPHVPMYVPKKWLDLHPLEKIKLPKVLANDRDDLSAYAKGLTHGFPAPRQEWFEANSGQWEKAVQAYLASSSFVDDCVGRVLKGLKESPHADNTIVVLFSDHGFHLGEKRRWAKRSLWEDSTRVPFIIVVPGSDNRKACSQPVGLIDIYPTLLELCTLKANEKLEGHSLKPLLDNSQAAWSHPAITTFGPGNHAIRSERYRYIRYADGSEELYDHQTDPHEWHNLANQPKMKTIIEKHRRSIPQKEKPVLVKFNNYGLKAFIDTERAVRGKTFPDYVEK